MASRETYTPLDALGGKLDQVFSLAFRILMPTKEGHKHVVKGGRADDTHHLTCLVRTPAVSCGQVARPYLFPPVVFCCFFLPLLLTSSVFMLPLTPLKCQPSKCLLRPFSECALRPSMIFFLYYIFTYFLYYFLTTVIINYHKLGGLK